MVRKMRNNAIRKFPKSMNQIASSSLMEMDDVYVSSRAEIEENENTEPFLIEGA